MATFQYVDQPAEQATPAETKMITAIKQDGQITQFDPEAPIFPVRWEVALAFTKRVIRELKEAGMELDELAVPQFITGLIDRCP